MIRLLIVVATLLGASACGSTKHVDVPLPATDPTRLDHEQHRLLHVPCGSCHRGDKPPGADDHKPCDDPACHKSAFLAAPGKLCQTCHTEITTQPVKAPLKEYREDPWQSLPPVFSHKQHMDAGFMESKVGFHVTCSDCHTRGEGTLVRPNHQICARCHASEAVSGNALSMDGCDRCHQGRARLRQRVRVIKGDIQFHHERHRVDRKGVAIKCEACHGRSATSQSYADHGPPRIESCVGCHDDSNRVPYQMRMRICENCHLERAASLTTIPPRDHLPATERPLDHTLAFRRDHAEAAGRDAQRCATCHTQMSGNPRQACDECHQRMLPADHRITWRELDHGPESAADKRRCATCHVVEFCTACHQQRPRSHGFPGKFLDEHARLARLNIRACLTCHVPDAGPMAGPGQFPGSCARCHDVSALRNRGGR